MVWSAPTLPACATTLAAPGVALAAAPGALPHALPALRWLAHRRGGRNPAEVAAQRSSRADMDAEAPPPPPLPPQPPRPPSAPPLPPPLQPLLSPPLPTPPPPPLPPGSPGPCEWWRRRLRRPPPPRLAVRPGTGAAEALVAGALIGRATADGGHRGGAVADPLRQAVALLERDADVRRGWPAAAAALAPDLHAALDALVAETAASVGGEGAAATRRAAAVLWWALLTAATAVGITAAPLVVDLLLDLSALPPLAAALHLPLSTASAVHLLAWGSVAAGATTAPGAPHPASATTTAAAAIATAATAAATAVVGVALAAAALTAELAAHLTAAEDYHGVTPWGAFLAPPPPSGGHTGLVAAAAGSVALASGAAAAAYGSQAMGVAAAAAALAAAAAATAAIPAIPGLADAAAAARIPAASAAAVVTAAAAAAGSAAARRAVPGIGAVALGGSLGGRLLQHVAVLAALRDEQRDRHNHQTAPEAVAFHGGRDAEDAPGT
ncbi:hypothetical protein I4F81_004765 [Pyropia yezoensis]|uniref:Uncharacterized protein n=1 Tax=Pyropia yezoensis TaxID=2788 RepID=A0ACC3BWS4_PYRYE|nr:hypothetical protein I4F81_004765 [Neopyropia yezoensis]